ncbi:putative cysteine peptidase [Mycoplasma sp. Z407A]|uniref:putative cysteine peptidase n=1 Tax=Mycoplasma sp. Z407A TaxID=3401678 RepID=UPI003AAE6982
MNKLTHKSNQIIFSKEINDIHNNKVLLIAFNSTYSIVDTNNFLTLETHWYDIWKYKNSENLIYIPTYGLFEKVLFDKVLNVETNLQYDINSFLVSTSQSDILHNLEFINEQKNKRIEDIKNSDLTLSSPYLIRGSESAYKPLDDSFIWLGSERTIYTEPFVSDLVEHSWWWLTRDSDQRIGYDEDRADEFFDKSVSSGWCCYNALANLLLYNELFKYKGVFSTDEYNNFITVDKNTENKLQYSSPVFKWNKYNDIVGKDEDRKSFPYYLHKLNNKNYNFKSSETGEKLNELYNKFIISKSAKNSYESEYSDRKSKAFKYAWRTIINDKLPVILSVGGVKSDPGFNHAFIAYGYDRDTDQFLVNNLWGDKKTSACLISYYIKADYYSYFTIKPKNFNNYYMYSDKYFTYENEKYNWRNIEDRILYDRDAKV